MTKKCFYNTKNPTDGQMVGSLFEFLVELCKIHQVKFCWLLACFLIIRTRTSHCPLSSLLAAISTYGVCILEKMLISTGNTKRNKT